MDQKGLNWQQIYTSKINMTKKDGKLCIGLYHLHNILIWFITFQYQFGPQPFSVMII